MLVAIHQPNFLPWLGYFNKLATADVFIILDTVALQRTGGNYTNRVQILVKGRPTWITVPMRRGEDARRRIDQARIAEDGAWRKKMTLTMQQHYARSPYFRGTMPLVEQLLSAPTDSLRDLNLLGIFACADAVGLDTRKLRLASDLTAAGRATDLLVELVRELGGNAYLAGGGSGHYQEDQKFEASGIEVRYQHFVPLVYPQSHTKRFVPGLSIIDALMNVGREKTATLIRNVSAPPVSVATGCRR